MLSGRISQTSKWPSADPRSGALDLDRLAAVGVLEQAGGAAAAGAREPLERGGADDLGRCDRGCVVVDDGPGDQGAGHHAGDRGGDRPGPRGGARPAARAEAELVDDALPHVRRRRFEALGADGPGEVGELAQVVHLRPAGSGTPRRG